MPSRIPRPAAWPLLLLAACHSPSEPLADGALRANAVWSPRAAIPVGVRAPAVTATSTQIFVIAGNAGASTLTADTRIYTPATGRWRLGRALPAPRDWAMAATLSDGVHFLGGIGPSGLAAEHWRLDAATNTWVARAPVPILVDAAVSRVVNDRLYLIGGGSAAGPTGAVQIYNPVTDQWSSGTPMPTPRLSTASAVSGRQILVAGGQTAGVGTTAAFEIYDTALDRWSTLSPMPDPREALGGGITGGQFCIFGGRLATGFPSGTPIPSTWCYNRTSGSWSQMPDMVTPRVEVAAIEFGGSIYAIGGRTATSFAVGTSESLR